MACYGCNDCNCTHSDTFSKDTHKQLRDKLSIFHDLVCVVSNTSCYDFPKVMAKFIYMLWCFLTDLVNLIMCLWERSRTLKKRDEELCAKDQQMASAFNTLLKELRKLNNSNREQYNLAMVKYNQEQLIAEQNNTKVGYLTQSINKDLIMGSEPKSTMTTSGKNIPENVYENLPQHPTTEWKDPASLNYSSYPKVSTTTAGKAQHFIMKKGDTVEVTYSDLTKTTYEGRPVSKMVFTYTLVSISGAKNQLIFNALANPTLTAYVHAWDVNGGKTPFEMETSFKIYVDDKEIIPTEESPFPVVFGSINSVSNTGEYISNFSGDFIPINGSAITAKNGKATNYSDKSIEDYARDAGSGSGNWDSAKSQFNWVGAIAGKATSPIRFRWGANSVYWFSFNTNVNAGGILIKPVAPYQLKLTELNVSCGDLSQMTCGLDVPKESPGIAEDDR